MGSGKGAASPWDLRAWDWAMYEENLNGDAYDRVFQLTGVGEGTDLLDVACGSGLALQRAAARGAACTGVDMSEELLRIAAERAPSARLLHCDMEATGLPDASFDVVTSFNGIQFGGASAVAECARLLRSGGLMALAFWQDPGDYEAYFTAIAACSPPSAPGATTPMALRKPGAAESLLESGGLSVVDRGTTVVRGLYRDADDARRGLSSSGPAMGAVTHAGEDAFLAHLLPVIAQYEDPDSGRVSMTATFGYAIGRRP